MRLSRFGLMVVASKLLRIGVAGRGKQRSVSPEGAHPSRVSNARTGQSLPLVVWRQSWGLLLHQAFQRLFENLHKKKASSKQHWDAGREPEERHAKCRQPPGLRGGGVLTLTIAAQNGRSSPPNHRDNRDPPWRSGNRRGGGQAGVRCAEVHPGLGSDGQRT